MSERIIAAVPTYNAGENLLLLGTYLRKEVFDEVYILDDCSTDNSVDELTRHFPEFNVVRGETNKGPGGNRNRILDYINDETVFFVDADMSLESTNIRSHITKALGKASVGMVGGLILSKDGNPMWWNYGFEMNRDKDTWFYELSKKLNQPDVSDEDKKAVLKQLRDADADYQWLSPETLELRTREVDWVAEGCFAIRGPLFKQISGYDEQMRYHEGQDLAKRVRDNNYEVVFDPTIRTKHLEIDVRGDRRQSDFKEGQFYFLHKHYGMTRAEFDSLYS